MLHTTTLTLRHFATRAIGLRLHPMTMAPLERYRESSTLPVGSLSTQPQRQLRAPSWPLFYCFRRSGCYPARRVMPLDDVPSSDLAGRSGCYTLSAVCHQHPFPLEDWAPAFVSLLKKTYWIRPLLASHRARLSVFVISELEALNPSRSACPVV